MPVLRWKSKHYDYVNRKIKEEYGKSLYIKYDIPCSKSTYYTLYRKFFYILDKLRDGSH